MTRDDELAKLDALRKSGVLTEEDFWHEKRKLFSTEGTVAPPSIPIAARVAPSDIVDQSQNKRERTSMSFTVASYDGRLPSHPQAEKAAELLLGGSGVNLGRWELHFKPRFLSVSSEPQIAGGGFAKYPMVASATGTTSCRITMSDKDNPSIGCAFELPITSVEEFNAAYADWQQRIEAAVEREAALNTARQAGQWWAGIQPAKLRGLELNPGRKPDYTGTLHVTERGGLKDDDPTKVWGLYYKTGGTFLGSRTWWLPLGGVKEIELAEADLHPSGSGGWIGFGPIGIAAILAAKEVSKHRAKAVRVLTITTGQNNVHHFQTKLSTPQVVGGLGMLMPLWVAHLKVQLDALNRAKTEVEARQREAAEEKRKAEIREQAQAIAQAVAPQASVADELAKLAQLKEAGVLTEEEFAAQKAKLLS